MTATGGLIERAKELDAAATPGPWVHCCPTGTGCKGSMVWAGDDEEEPLARTDKDRAGALGNMAFIAESRTLLLVIARAAGDAEKERDAAVAQTNQVIDTFNQETIATGKWKEGLDRELSALRAELEARTAQLLRATDELAEAREVVAVVREYQSATRNHQTDVALQKLNEIKLSGEPT